MTTGTRGLTLVGMKTLVGLALLVAGCASNGSIGWDSGAEDVGSDVTAADATDAMEVQSVDVGSDARDAVAEPEACAVACGDFRCLRCGFGCCTELRDSGVEDVVETGDAADVVTVEATAPDGGLQACDDTVATPSTQLDAWCAANNLHPFDPSYRAGPPRCITRGEPMGSYYAPVLTDTTAVCETCHIDATLGTEVCICYRTLHGAFGYASPPTPCMVP